MAALTMCSEHKEFTGLKEDLKALGLQGNLFSPSATFTTFERYDRKLNGL
jgi:hypothetical protein